MNASAMQLTILAVLGLFAGRLAAAEVAPPLTYPADLGIPYSPDNPPGPTFSEAEKHRQLASGQRIRREILTAFNAGRDSYTIPAGDYRFGAAPDAVTVSESGSVIWDHGTAKAGATAGVEFAGAEAGYLIFLVGSGAYRFTCQQ